MVVDLMLGDCLERMKEIPDGSIDMILCDLPYAVTKLKWDVLIPFDKLWCEYNRIAKPNAAVLLFGAEPFSSALRLSNIENYKYDWYWHKNKPTGGALSSKQPMRCFETISVFYCQQPTYNPIMGERTEQELKRLSKNSLTKCDSDLYGANGYTQVRENLKEKFPTNYLNHKTVHSRDAQKTKHPTQKPVELLEYLINTFTNTGETVLDNCMGSGSTGVACANIDRNFIGIEMDETYYNIATKRIAGFNFIKEKQ